ncbi:SMP-30/gluconolactonase/LRE family protein [Roseovarius sp.]|uniref:SMP-30/gluconolactonase/LRE family protein n=1 Tax=Roseovarius sp. TaxID=1486281 RepID=UPI003BA9DCD5
MALERQAAGDARSRPTSRDRAVHCLWQGPARLGESPLWDTRRNRLFWIDCLGQTLWSANADGGDPRSWNLPDVIGSIGLCEDGRLVVGFARGFALVTPGQGGAEVEWIGDPDPDNSGTRLNDGKVDRQGRFWCGTMNIDFTATNAALFRLDPNGTWARIDDGFTVSNGIAFSPDGARMYFSDSRVDRSYQYDLDRATGQLSNRRAFLDTTAYEGRVDGATVDADGCYWAALFSGGAVARFDPDGTLMQKIDLPVSCPTMCSFGGPDLDILYVTSATFTLEEDELAQQPLAGALFAIEGLGARGLEEPRFATPG